MDKERERERERTAVQKHELKFSKVVVCYDQALRAVAVLSETGLCPAEPQPLLAFRGYQASLSEDTTSS